MANTAVVASVTGIVVAGVVGPMATAWATRRANRQQFERDQTAKRRADLRDLIDEAAKLLGAGATNLRLASEASTTGKEEPAEVREWAANVHLLKQRLLLRLPPSNAVMQSFESVLTALETIGRAEGRDYLHALKQFESARGRFLEEARTALSAPISKAD
jgi:hypothetical protein